MASVDITNSLYPFLLATLAANLLFLPSVLPHRPLEVFQGSLFCWGLSPINDVFISPAVSNDSKLQGKFMPTFFCVIELVHFYASQVILIITHFDEIYPF